MRLPSGAFGLPAVLSVALLVALPIAAHGTPPEGTSDGDLVSVGTYRTIPSDILGEERTILVCLPREYEQSSMSHPVMYVLYGDQVRGYFSEAVHIVHRLATEGSIPATIVVGVANVDRYRDLSPVGRRDAPSGIEPFSRFVTEELFPFVEAEYRTKDYRILVGPQAGAAFGLYTLAKRPELFDALVMENPLRSPPVREALLPLVDEAIDDGLPSPVFLHVTCSDRVGPLVKPEELAHMRSLEAEIVEQDPPNLTLVAHYVEGSEDFLPPLRLKEALRSLFAGYKLADDAVVDGLSDITGHYGRLSSELGFEVDVPEMILYQTADVLVRGGSPDSARVLLEYLVETHPASVNGYWGLANLHRESGERELAIQSYRKCLELMPGMGPAIYWLGQLESDD